MKLVLAAQAGKFVGGLPILRRKSQYLLHRDASIVADLAGKHVIVVTVMATGNVQHAMAQESTIKL